MSKPVYEGSISSNVPVSNVKCENFEDNVSSFYEPVILNDNEMFGSRSESSKLNAPTLYELKVQTCAETSHSSNLDLLGCLLCNSANHRTNECTVYTISGARRKIKSLRLCFKCLSPNFETPHQCRLINQCENSLCGIKNQHDKFICRKIPSMLKCVLFSTELKYKTHGINRLSTMLLWVQDPVSNLLCSLRCMLDTGASHSYIRSRSSKLLNLEFIERKNAQISSFGRTEFQSCNIVHAMVYGSRDNSCSPSDITLIAMDNLCCPEPSHELSSQQWKVIKERNLTLADCEAAHDGLLPIDIIIGQDFYYTFVNGTSLALPDGLRLVLTVFDTYMLAGSSTSALLPPEKTLQASNLVSSSSALSHDEERITLEEFSSLDMLGIRPEEDVDPVVQHFNDTVRYVGDRFEVELPKKYPQITKLDTNLPQCFSRLVSGYQKRQKNPDQTQFIKYNNCIQDYVERGYLEKVAKLGSVSEVKQKLAENPCAFDRVGITSDNVFTCCLPHHAVYKASTGKLRVVYDGKAKPHKGACAINDTLEKGPNKMNPLLHILLKLRKGKVAAKADIERAYLQVQICEKDRDLLRILWIEDGQVWIYRFARLPFGIRPAPFLLASVMSKQLADSDMDEDTKDRILASFYVDDSVYATDTVDELIDLKSRSVESFKRAGMILREWNSNDTDARASFGKEENREPPEQEAVLGLLWDLPSDTIGINDQRILNQIGKKPKTKRSLWSFINKLHDPLGLLSPYTIQAKHLAREASIACRGWDSRLPDVIANKVTKWMEDFSFIKDIRLPRYIGLDNSVWQRLVGFCDASGTGIAACVYLVSSNGEKVVSHLVKANTHIPTASMKSRIPRTELIGAVMLANLMTFVRKSYSEIPLDHVHYFTDSVDVLYWIYSGASHWDTFVSNRVATIRELTEVKSWKHVSSAKNPADPPSRGCSLAKLRYLSLYWHGPEFIRGNMVDEDSTAKGYDAAYTNEMPDGCKVELKVRANFVSVAPLIKPAADISKILDVSKYGTYSKLVGVTKAMLRFMNKCDKARTVSTDKPNLLQVINYDLARPAEVYKGAEILWVQATQLSHFPEMYKLIKNIQARVSPSQKSIFLEHRVHLEPEHKVLCCKTRMEYSDLPDSAIYPMLLPSNSIFTDLLIRDRHITIGHAGTPQTLAHLRSEYWILQGRKSVQKVLRRCVRCRKVDGNCYSLPSHPPLPDFRTQRNRPYSFTGLDYMGPFTIKDPGAENFVSKVYVLMLTCTSSRSVHLEATRSLALNDFLMALDRFFSNRGIPYKIESDNYSTFVRCKKRI